MHSARHSAGADFDLYVSQRLAVDLPWGAPVSLGPILNSAFQDVTAALSSNGRYLFFASLRTGNFDIYVSQRRDRHDDFSWEAPTPLPPPVNGASFDASPSYFENPDGRPQLYFASDRANGLGQAGLDIYMSELRHDGRWGTPALVAELNSAFEEGRTAIRSDGLEIVFNTNREGSQDLYVSRRNHVWEPWSTPENLGSSVNTSASDSQPALSANGRTLYFSSNRPGGLGIIDLYVSTRSERRRDDRREHDDDHEACHSTRGRQPGFTC